MYFFTAIGFEDIISIVHMHFAFATTSGVTLYTNCAGAVDTENLNMQGS
jgi:hypothetical protein